MVKSEIAEIKKQFNPDNCAITKVSGCYVTGEKEIKARFTNTFLNMPEDEIFKYFEIFKKTLSGALGKNLINLSLPTAPAVEVEKEENELEANAQETLLKLRASELKDEDLLKEFYANIVQSYECTDSYYITLIYGAYDVPCKTKDKQALEDASEEVYSYILCSISPVTLSKAGLCFNEEACTVEKQTRAWVVGAPSTGFLFPAFNDRSADINNVLYYAKDAENLQKDFVYGLLGCDVPMTAGVQKELFQTIIKQILGDACDYSVLKTIHTKLKSLVDMHKLKQIPEPLVLSKAEVKGLLSDSGVASEKLTDFESKFEALVGENLGLLADNVTNPKVFEVKTSAGVLKVTPDSTDMVDTKLVDGRKCLVIQLTDEVKVNGIQLSTR